MALKVSRVAIARATRSSGSSLSSAAIWRHGRPHAAIVRGPSSAMKSSDPSAKRPSPSVCQTKRNGSRRSMSA
jgi:hypothetical protein